MNTETEVKMEDDKNERNNGYIERRSKQSMSERIKTKRKWSGTKRKKKLNNKRKKVIKEKKEDKETNKHSCK
jgi:hypothetical protein